MLRATLRVETEPPSATLCATDDTVTLPICAEQVRVIREQGGNPQEKTVTPSAGIQVITPDSPTYDCLSQVTVNAIPYTETDNAAGGRTVTIGL